MLEPTVLSAKGFATLLQILTVFTSFAYSVTSLTWCCFQWGNLGVGPTPRTTEVPLAQGASIPFVYHYLKILATLDVNGVDRNFSWLDGTRPSC